MAVQVTARRPNPNKRRAYRGRRRLPKRVQYARRAKAFGRGAARLSLVTLHITGVLVLALLVGMGLRDAGPPEHPVPQAAPPSLGELNASIKEVEAYLDGLYRPLPGGMAVQSETYTIPLRAEFDRNPKWELLGAGQAGCVTSCSSGATITPGPGSASSESYVISFGKRLSVRVAVDWGLGSKDITITTTPVDVAESAVLWLNDVKLASLQPGDSAPMERQINRSEVSAFQSLRYTVRHAVQEAYMYHLVRGDENKARALAKFLRSNGFTPGMDIRAPLFKQSSNLPDDLPVNDRAYEDCRHQPRPTINAYPYISKVCLAVDPYLFVSSHDGLLQAYQAIHTLQKYGPSKEYAGGAWDHWWEQGSTPMDTSRQLQRQWQRTGFGVPACTPLTCSDQASGIRTFAFGLLQTMIGYEAGDPTARRFADAAAAATLKSQVRHGEIHLPDATLYRPIQNGSFPVAWDKEGHFVAPSDPTFIGGPVMLATGKLSMPPEYRGVPASNTETTADAWAFLTRYRCAVYGVGCEYWR